MSKMDPEFQDDEAPDMTQTKHPDAPRGGDALDAFAILNDLREWYEVTDIGPHGSALLADGDVTLRDRIDKALGIRAED